MFLETDGSLVWLYSCPQVRSPLHTLKQCYDKIPILYKGQIQFVDPITRQTLPDALPQNCSDPIKKVFRMDMDQKDSWYSLTPEITHRDRPALFIRPQRYISLHYAKVHPIRQSRNVYKRTTQ